MILLPFVLSLTLPAPQVQTPESIAAIVRGLLPLTATDPDPVLRQLATGEGKLDLRQAMLRDPLRILSLSGCEVSFTRAGSLWSFHGRGGSDGRFQTALPAEAFYAQGTAVASVLKVKYDRLEMELQRWLQVRGEYTDVTLTLQPFLDGHCCTGPVRLTLDCNTAKLISVAKYREDLDWDRLRGGPRISRQQAEASAVQAYLRFDPFPTAHISEAELQFGCPAWEDILTPDSKFFIGEEFQGDEQELIDRRIAWPFWVVVFKEGLTESSHAPICCVYVDARNGHAAIAEKKFPRSGVLTESGYELGPKVTVEEPLTHTKERITAEASPATGQFKDVLLTLGSTFVRCKFDAKSGIIQIPSAGKESAFRCPQRLRDGLKKQVDAKPFGGK